MLRRCCGTRFRAGRFRWRFGKSDHNCQQPVARASTPTLELLRHPARQTQSSSSFCPLAGAKGAATVLANAQTPAVLGRQPLETRLTIQC